MKKLARKGISHVKEIPPNRVRELRKAQNLTLEQLAEMTGIELSIISRIETRQRNINGVELILLSHHLKASPLAIYDLDFGFQDFDTQIDQIRMDGVIIGLLEAYESNRTRPTPADFSRLVTFIYNTAETQRLSLGHVREMAKNLVKIGKKGVKADPALLGKVG